MYPYGGGMGAGAWISMAFVLIAVLGLLVAVALAVVRGADRSSPAAAPRDEPERTLADRFAHGDIDAEEYETRLRTIRANRP